MSLVKRNNVVFPSFIDDVFTPDWFGGIEKFSKQTPAVNIKEDDNGYQLALAVPGLKKEQFNIEVDKDVLTISSEVKQEAQETKDNYTRKEFSFSSFKRVFTLPETVDADKINAVYEDGILQLDIPKKEEALPKPKRLIEIA